MGRTWQCGTIQVDFAMPERLDISYTGADNEEHRPVMIHRALLGSIERFMGILLEHYGGNLPTWLAPQQVLVLPIADRHADYAAEVVEPLRAGGAAGAVNLYVDVDDRGESVGKRIRDAQLQKVPYILVVGDREAESGAVGVRERGEDKGARRVERVRRTAHRRGTRAAAAAGLSRRRKAPLTSSRAATSRREPARRGSRRSASRRPAPRVPPDRPGRPAASAARPEARPRA